MGPTKPAAKWRNSSLCVAKSLGAKPFQATRMRNFGRGNPVERCKEGKTECHMGLLLRLFLFVALTSGAVAFYALPYLSLDLSDPTIVATLREIAPI
jgi:hypothetical protein